MVKSESIFGPPSKKAPKASGLAQMLARQTAPAEPSEDDGGGEDDSEGPDDTATVTADEYQELGSGTATITTDTGKKIALTLGETGAEQPDESGEPPQEGM